MGKKCFNILLNSTDTSSYNGLNGNANYYISFGNIISKEDMDQPYKVTLRFKSKQTSAQITDTLYFLSMNFLNKTRVQQNTSFSQIFAILSRYTESITAPANGSTLTYQYECLQPDNPPVYLDNLRDIAQLSVKITTDDMKTTVTGFPNYAIILNFEQV